MPPNPGRVINKTKAVAVSIQAVSPGFTSEERAAGERIVASAIRQ